MGEEIAEALFMLEGGRLTVVFLVPQNRLETADASQQVTLETLLRAATIPNDEVESWRLGDGSLSGVGGDDPGLSYPLPTPPPDETHLTVQVHLKPPTQAASNESGEQEIPLEKWQALEALWKGILGLEASIDTSRLGMDSLRSEMEAAF